MFHPGDKVKTHSGDVGTVLGHVLHPDSGVLYVIDLNQGFWDENRKRYLSILTVNACYVSHRTPKEARNG